MLFRSLCWTYEQIGLTNVLSEWNSFVCRGLTVYVVWGLLFLCFSPLSPAVILEAENDHVRTSYPVLPTWHPLCSGPLRTPSPSTQSNQLEHHNSLRSSPEWFLSWNVGERPGLCFSKCPEAERLQFAFFGLSSLTPLPSRGSRLA